MVTQHASPTTKGTDKGPPTAIAGMEHAHVVKSDEARTIVGRGGDGADGGGGGERGVEERGGVESSVEMQARAHLDVVQSYIQGAQERHR